MTIGETDMTSEFAENEIEFGRAAVAMLAEGYTPARLHWLVTCGLICIPANGKSASSARCYAHLSQ